MLLIFMHFGRNLSYPFGYAGAAITRNKYFMKKFGMGLIVLIAIIAGALFWLRDNLDGLVRNAIIEYGSEMTQAKVSVGSVKIDAVNGECTISDFIVGNPKGFSTPYAFKVDAFTLALDLASITDSVVVIRKIAIIAPEVIYEKGDVMTNFDAIQKNIADYIGPSSHESSPGKKLIVEEFKMRDSKAQATAAFMDNKTVTADLPDLTMRNIGKAEGGITPGELGQRIAGAMEKQLLKAVSFDKLGKAAQQAGEAISDAAGGAADKIKGLF